MLVAMIKTVATALLMGLAFISVAQADTDLENSMKKMGKAYKQLSLDLKQPSDASKADYLALAGTLKTEAQTSRGLVPKKAAALPADQQATMVAAYQKSMDDLSATIDTLTTAIQGSQWDDARKAMDKLKEQMFAGHKEFRTQKKDGPGTPAPAAAPTASTPTTSAASAPPAAPQRAD
jgi:cytochrome c556